MSAPVRAGERGLRPRPAEGARVGALPDGVGLVAQAAPGHGPPRPGPLGGRPGVAVEMGCTFVGGRTPGGNAGARYANKDEVVIAVELVHPRGFGRVGDGPHRRARSARSTSSSSPRPTSPPAPSSTPTATGCTTTSTSRSPSPTSGWCSWALLSPPTACCRPCTGWPRCSSAGPPAPSTTARTRPTSTTTSTSSPSGSTVARATAEACCGTAWSTRPCAPTPTPTENLG